MATEMLHTYMQDHHAGAAAGVDLFRRVAESHDDAHIREVVSRLGDQTEEDKRSLEDLMTLVGTSPSTLKDLSHPRPVPSSKTATPASRPHITPACRRLVSTAPAGSARIPAWI